MYKINHDNSFYLCEYNFELHRWERIKHFKSEQELILYVASHFQYDRINDFRNYVNYTGKDTVTYDNIRYFRDIMIVDSNDRIIDWREYEEKALYEYGKPEPKRRYWWGRHIPPYEYRYDPVGFTGHARYRGRYGRTVKHWFRSYKDDRVPEHKEYVRKKAMVPNTWDTEPVEHVERCWKHQKKCRHQWEKNLYRKKETYNFRQMQQKEKEEYNSIVSDDPWRYCEVEDPWELNEMLEYAKWENWETHGFAVVSA